MKKLITIDNKDYIIERHGKNWYCRAKETLIIQPTIKEMKAAITQVQRGEKHSGVYILTYKL